MYDEKNDIGPVAPKCQVEGCEKDACMLVGKLFMCGECIMKYTKAQQDIEKETQSKILERMKEM